MECTTGPFEDENERNSKCWNAFCKCKDECPKAFDKVTTTTTTAPKRRPIVIQKPWFNLRNGPYNWLNRRRLDKKNPCRRDCNDNNHDCLSISQSFGDRLTCFQHRRFCFIQCRTQKKYVKKEGNNREVLPQAVSTVIKNQKHYP